jgi:hypothetical protein
VGESAPSLLGHKEKKKKRKKRRRDLPWSQNFSKKLQYSKIHWTKRGKKERPSWV